MKNKYGWGSEFRRKKFFEKHYNKSQNDAELVYLNMENMMQPSKTIAVMLDLEGTIDNIDDDKAKLFMQQLEFIRRKFGAEYGSISLSTHYSDYKEMVKYLEILARNLSKNIKIGLNFYYGGIYDFDKKTVEPREFDYNINKVKTFTEYYVHDMFIQNKWFAIIDDQIKEETYRQFQDNRPMVVCRPSQKETFLKYNNFMNKFTMTKGFDGVLEALQSYIEQIKNLSSIQILETQRNMMVHLASYELVDKLRKGEFQYIERYFKEGFADETDYRDILNWLFILNCTEDADKDELKYLNNILAMLSEIFKNNNNLDDLERVNELRRKLN